MLLVFTTTKRDGSLLLECCWRAEEGKSGGCVDAGRSGRWADRAEGAGVRQMAGGGGWAG